jgi:hypothetical protein
MMRLVCFIQRSEPVHLCGFHQVELDEEELQGRNPMPFGLIRAYICPVSGDVLLDVESVGRPN